MSCVLTKGRTEPCRDNIGGVKFIYFAPFVLYADSFIDGVKGVEITSFPETTFYKYEPNNANFSENIINDENGIKYSQSLTFTLAKQDITTTKELDIMQSIDLRYVVEYNNGSLKMGGVYNGAMISNYTIDSGGSKNSLNGYNITITSDEQYAAPFLNDFGIIDGFLLLETNFNYLLEDSNKIILQ